MNLMQAVVLAAMFLLGANCGFLVSKFLPSSLRPLCMLAAGVLMAIVTFTPARRLLAKKPGLSSRTALLVIAAISLILALLTTLEI